MRVCWDFSSGSTKTLNDAPSQPVSVPVLATAVHMQKLDILVFAIAMASLSLREYLNQIGSCWTRRRAAAAAELLSLRHVHSSSAQLLDSVRSGSGELLDRECRRLLPAALHELVAAHLRCAWALSEGDCDRAFSCQSLAVSVFSKLFATQRDDNWCLPVMCCLCLDLRRVAMMTDADSCKHGRDQTGDLLEKAAEGLMGCFRICAGDTRTDLDCTKRWGMLPLVNQLFKIYFRVNKLQLCRPLIRAIESLSFSDDFSLAQLVTYRYFTGRKAMFDGDYKSANETLSFAFVNCHKQCEKNKRLILIYLIPVRMLLGSMPTQSLLSKYRLTPYSEVVSAVKQGHLKRLADAMVAHQTFFIKCGVYLILEKLRTITYRNLFKKVYLLSGSVQLDISRFRLAAVLTGADQDMDDDETACILANLICQGRIKGYIAHSHGKLVLSKKEPFPSLSSISVP